MHKGLRAGLLILINLVLAGCAGKPAEQTGRLAQADRAELLARLQLGQPVLDCREPCLESWKRVQPEAARLDTAGRWDELAVLVIRAGYEDDLSLYYLGRAAAGRGAGAAAARYYRDSMRISGTPAACATLSHLCAGLVFPRAAGERLADAERLLAPPKRRFRPPGTPAQPTTSDAAASATSAPLAGSMPPTGPAPEPAPPAAKGAAEPAGSSDYIEPPPASR